MFNPGGRGGGVSWKKFISEICFPDILKYIYIYIPLGGGGDEKAFSLVLYLYV